MMERCCGTCKWWADGDYPEGWGDCTWEGIIPRSMTFAPMRDTAGTDCPCYTKKEE